MIVDSIQNVHLYENISPRFKKLFDYLKENDLSSFAPGVYEIDGKDIYFTIKEYDSRDAEKANWETHQKYIDVQYLLSGKELMGYAQVDGLEVKVPYDEEMDRIFYQNVKSDGYLKVSENMYVILFQHDAHLASLTDGEVSRNKKAIIKVKI
ncbi:MAG: YhcH/YjgK/YiaL family protein [Clostridia bacterium]